MSYDSVPPLGDKPHYFGSGYNSLERFMSYGYQLSEIWKAKAPAVLEVGVGSGLIANVLRNAGVEVTTLDIDPRLKPDVVASVEHIPLPDNAIDTVACFEVLEHLPFERFGSALRELHRVSARLVIISLPDSTPVWRFCTPRFHGCGGCFLVTNPFRRAQALEDNSEHCWEIGVPGYPLRRIVNAMSSVGLRVARNYRVWENPYHRMFVLSK